MWGRLVLERNRSLAGSWGFLWHFTPRCTIWTWQLLRLPRGSPLGALTSFLNRHHLRSWKCCWITRYSCLTGLPSLHVLSAPSKPTVYASIGWQTLKLRSPLKNTPILGNINLYGLLWLDEPHFLSCEKLFFFTPKERIQSKEQFIFVYIPWVLLLPSWFHWYAILV